MQTFVRMREQRIHSNLIGLHVDSLGGLTADRTGALSERRGRPRHRSRPADDGPRDKVAGDGRRAPGGGIVLHRFGFLAAALGACICPAARCASPGSFRAEASLGIGDGEIRHWTASDDLAAARRTHRPPRPRRDLQKPPRRAISRPGAETPLDGRPTMAAAPARTPSCTMTGSIRACAVDNQAIHLRGARASAEGDTGHASRAAPHPGCGG